MKLNQEDIYKQYMYSYPHKTAYRDIEDISILDYKDSLEPGKVGLYAHIPFCSKRCGYCNLFSLSGENFTLMDEYIIELEKEAEVLGKNLNLNIDNYTIGGGTPFYLLEDNLERLLKIPEKYFNKKNEEIFIGIETSPRETTREKLKIIENNKVNRLSIGVQSFIDSELSSLKRDHNRELIINALENIKKIELEILNIDLIYGIENQTRESILFNIDEALKYAPDELFIYPLYVRNNKVINDEGNKYELYKIARDYLIDNGYIQQSMRRFTKRKLKNITCGFEKNLSIGIGGRTYIEDLHTCFKYSDNQKNIHESIKEYINTKDKTIYNHGYYLDEEEMKRRFLIKNLFITSGLEICDYEKMFNSNIFLDFPIFKKWEAKKLLSIQDDRIILTDLGISLSDMLGPELISEKVEIKMNEWVDI